MDSANSLIASAISVRLFATFELPGIPGPTKAIVRASSPRGEQWSPCDILRSASIRSAICLFVIFRKVLNVILSFLPSNEEMDAAFALQSRVVVEWCFRPNGLAFGIGKFVIPT